MRVVAQRFACARSVTGPRPSSQLAATSPMVAPKRGDHLTASLLHCRVDGRDFARRAGHLRWPEGSVSASHNRRCASTRRSRAPSRRGRLRAQVSGARIRWRGAPLRRTHTASPVSGSNMIAESWLRFLGWVWFGLSVSRRYDSACRSGPNSKSPESGKGAYGSAKW